jgi:hypothetical protein
MPLASLDEGAYNKLVAAQDGYVLLDQKTVAYWRPPPRPIDPGSITDHASAGGHTCAAKPVRWTIPGPIDHGSSGRVFRKPPLTCIYGQGSLSGAEGI